MRDPNCDYCPRCGKEVGRAGLCSDCVKPTFRIARHTAIDKSFKILGPIELEVDYDDVSHKVQDELAKKVVAILNERWND